MLDGPIRAMTVAGIAREAGVGKPTIYRWWDDKCSLVMEAFFDTMTTGTTFPECETIAESVADHVQRVVRLLRGPAGRIVAEIVGEGQSQPEILVKFRERFFGQLLSPARMALERGKESGELDVGLNEDLVLDLIYGPVCYRLLLGHQPLDERFADEVGGQALSTLQRFSNPND